MKKRKLLILLLISLVILPLVLWHLIVIFDLNEFWCIRTELDIHSGDIRQQRYIAFVKVSENINTTSFSRLVRDLNLLEPNYQPVWRLVDISGTLFYKIYDAGKWSKEVHWSKFLFELLNESKLSKDQQKDIVKLFMNYLEKGETDKYFDREDIKSILFNDTE